MNYKEKYNINFKITKTHKVNIVKKKYDTSKSLKIKMPYASQRWAFNLNRY